MKNEDFKKELELTNELKNAVNKNSDSSTFSRIYNNYHEFILKNGLPSEKRKKDGYLYAPPNYQNLAEKIIFKLIPKNSKLLEIGFGDGRLSYQLARGKNCAVTAIDISDVAVKIAQKNFRLSPTLNYLKADARKLPFQNESFDFVLSKDLIEHLPAKDHRNHFNEVKRVLKNNGLYIFFTPSKIIPRKSRGLHLKEYNLRELLERLVEYGFKNEKIYLVQTAILGISSSLPKFLIKTVGTYETLMEKTKIHKLLIFGGMHKFLLPRYIISAQK